MFPACSYFRQRPEHKFPPVQPSDSPDNNSGSALCGNQCVFHRDLSKSSFAIRRRTINNLKSYYTNMSAFLMGSILSCTDTAAVVALLKEVGAPQKFRSLIEGESLINDATCMILIIISVNIIKGTSSGFFAILINFLSLSIGGMLIGVFYFY